MPKPSHRPCQQELVSSSRRNVFLALYDSSESEEESSESHAEVVEGPEEGTVECPEEGTEGPSLTADAQQYRKWSRPDTGRFSSDSSANIFSSPFYKGKRVTSKHWTRPRFVEDTDGWVSIRQGSEDSTTDVIYEERPLPKTPTGETIIFPPEDISADSLSANVWAERIKNTLEKAEQTRAATARDSKVDEEFKASLQRLSFFRRPMTTS